MSDTVEGFHGGHSLLDQIARELDRPVREPEDITVREVMEYTGKTERAVRRLLEKKVRNKELQKIQTMENGHPVCLYRRRNPHHHEL